MSSAGMEFSVLQNISLKLRKSKTVVKISYS